MSLQNLLNKLADFFSLKNINHLIINSFREIMLFISACGLLIIVIVIFIAVNTRPSYEKTTVLSNSVPITNEKSSAAEDMLITQDDLLMPEIKVFDVTNDYVEFLPTKRYQMPDLRMTVKTYDSMMQDTIEEGCRFNFENRKSSQGEK